MEKRHQQKEISIGSKTIMVDSVIVPLVKYINSFKNTYTLYSCEGDPLRKCNGSCAPYISFVCGNKDSLAKIRRLFKQYSRKENIKFKFVKDRNITGEYKNKIRYQVYFSKKKDLKGLIKYILVK